MALIWAGMPSCLICIWIAIAFYFKCAFASKVWQIKSPILVWPLWNTQIPRRYEYLSYRAGKEWVWSSLLQVLSSHALPKKISRIPNQVKWQQCKGSIITPNICDSLSAVTWDFFIRLSTLPSASPVKKIKKISSSAIALCQVNSTMTQWVTNCTKATAIAWESVVSWLVIAFISGLVSLPFAKVIQNRNSNRFFKVMRKRKKKNEIQIPFLKCSKNEIQICFSMPRVDKKRKIEMEMEFHFTRPKKDEK